MAKKTTPPPDDAAKAAPPPDAEKKAAPEPEKKAAREAEKRPAPDVAAQADGPRKKKKTTGKAPPRGKKLKNHLKNIEKNISSEGPQPLKRAVATLKSLKRAKFDETVEIHMHLGVDVLQADQLVRGSVSLPNGIGKTVRVVVFTQADNVAEAKAAGVDVAGGDDVIEKIQKENWLDFDLALATQDMMGKVSRLGKVLGPRGLMPTPKAGTVVSMTADLAAVVKEFKAGKVEYRTGKSGKVHARVGKMSFDEGKLVENIQVFIDQIRGVKPAGVKGHYILSTTIS